MSIFFLGCIYIIPKIICFFYPFTIGLIIALIANPLVTFLERHLHIMHKESSALVIVGVIAVILGFVYLIGYLLVRQGIAFAGDLPALYDQLMETVTALIKRFEENYKDLSPALQGILNQLIESANAHMTDLLRDINMPSLQMAGDVLKSFADGLFTIIMAIMSSYFFVADKEQMMGYIKKKCRKDTVQKMNCIFSTFKYALGGYFKAQIELMLMVMVVLTIGFLFLRLDYAILLAFLVSFVDFLPVFGIGTVLWPWMFLDIVAGKYSEATVLLILYIILQIAKQVLEPKLLSDSVGIRPLTSLFFMFIGYELKGVLGMILAIPLGIVLINLVRMGFFGSYFESLRILLHDLNVYRKL